MGKHNYNFDEDWLAVKQKRDIMEWEKRTGKHMAVCPIQDADDEELRYTVAFDKWVHDGKEPPALIPKHL